MKYFILILGIFLLSGCSVDYHLNIDENNKISESITVKSENEEESQKIHLDPWPIKTDYNDPDVGENPEKIEGVNYYQEEITLHDNLYHKNISYSYDIDSFKNANSINSCYEHFYIHENKKENTISLSTSAKFLCLENYPNLNQVNVKITVENPVVTNNASNINGNTYEWQITKDNYESSAIILSFKKDKQDKKAFNKNNPKISPTIYIFLGAFLLVLIVLIAYKVKNDK